MPYDLKSKEVKKPAEMPKGPLYCIMTFEVQTYVEPGWAPHDPPSTSHYNDNRLYVTNDSEAWRHDIDKFLKEKPGRTDLIAFHTGGVAEVTTETKVVIKESKL